jgi:hypothetical protein
MNPTEFTSGPRLSAGDQVSLTLDRVELHMSYKLVSPVRLGRFDVKMISRPSSLTQKHDSMAAVFNSKTLAGDAKPPSVISLS